jgi:transketolase N-terminal domain/subunit
MQILDYTYFSHIISSPKTEKPNKFIFSKRRSVIGQFVILNSHKIISGEELLMYCKLEGVLDCHPDYSVKGT